MENKKIIGLGGIARSGKTTALNLMKDRITAAGFKAEEYSIAEPVRQVVSIMFNVPIETLRDDDMKDELNEYWNLTYREMMQKVGHESSRLVFFMDFWTRNLESRINDSDADVILLADVRFPTDADWVLGKSGIIVNVNNDYASQEHKGTHSSELGLPKELIDVEIDNNGTLDELKVYSEAVASIVLNEMSRAHSSKP